MSELEQRETATGLREGRAEAWQALYDECAKPAWRLAARLLGPNSADVADVVQETFLAAARSTATFDPARGTTRQWICGILRRQVALHFRKTNQRRRLTEAAAESTIGGGDDLLPHQWLEIKELSLLVRASLTELQGDYGELLMAKYLDGESVEAIASAQNCTAEAVRSRLARARRAFRKVMRGHLETDLIAEK